MHQLQCQEPAFKSTPAADSVNHFPTLSFTCRRVELTIKFRSRSSPHAFDVDLHCVFYKKKRTHRDIHRTDAGQPAIVQTQVLRTDAQTHAHTYMHTRADTRTRVHESALTRKRPQAYVTPVTESWMRHACLTQSVLVCSYRGARHRKPRFIHRCAKLICFCCISQTFNLEYHCTVSCAYI